MDKGQRKNRMHSIPSENIAKRIRSRCPLAFNHTFQVRTISRKKKKQERWARDLEECQKTRDLQLLHELYKEYYNLHSNFFCTIYTSLLTCCTRYPRPLWACMGQDFKASRDCWITTRNCRTWSRSPALGGCCQEKRERGTWEGTPCKDEGRKEESRERKGRGEETKGAW